MKPLLPSVTGRTGLLIVIEHVLIVLAVAAAAILRFSVGDLQKGANPLGIMHALGNAAEWCHASDHPENYILRGCSIATANINDVRVTWRAKGDEKGEESSGFRAMIPIVPEQTTSTAGTN